jgi:2-iminobutanoate/2-iminopropanoate deaminase
LKGVKIVTKQCINVEDLPKSMHSHAVKVGNLIFTTGQIGRDPQTNQLLEGMEQQARQALTNLKILVESQGLTLDNIARLTIYVTNIDELSKLNEVYFNEFFPENRPARTCIEVSKIGIGAVVEIDAVIVCD